MTSFTHSTQTRTMTALPPLSLYIHVPYCIHKCSYCDFFSIGVGNAAIPSADIMTRIVHELSHMVDTLGLQGRTVQSIFFGGGTPSMVPARELARVLDCAAQHFVMGDIEITCEANPETVHDAMARALRAMGVNRLSIGVQSFHAHHLKFLERVHSSDRAIAAIAAAQTAGFTNLNLDLIFGLPDQTPAEITADIAQALRLGTTHISAYQLTIEPHTPLAAQVSAGRVMPIDDERALRYWLSVRAQLAAAGFTAYEVSNFARDGFPCAHNRHYWRMGEYLGVGPGAVSRIDNRRWRRARHLKKYLAGELIVDESETLTPAAQQLEFGMLNLRTTEGLSLEYFQQHFGATFDDCYPMLRQRWNDAGWLASDDPIILNERGLAVLDSLAAEL